MHVFRVSLLVSALVAVAFAEIAGQTGGPPWPANVRVNQDHDGKQQGETSLAVDPKDPLHLVTVFWEVISYDPQNLSMREKRVNWAWTRDGGLTWQSRRFENGVYSSDPSIVADSQGNFYIETILAPGFPNIDFEHASLAILKSTDGGETFAQTAEVALGHVMDKPYLTIDPDTDALYLFWTDFGPKRPANNIRIAFAASRDHGITFSEPRLITAPSSWGTFATAEVGLAGEIYATWTTTGRKLWLDRSLDGGRTWLSKDLPVADIPGAGTRTGDAAMGWPTLAVDRSGGPHHGRIYVVWTEYALRLGHVELTWSDDRADHWSKPVQVDEVENAGDSHQLAWVVVDGRGGVHVTYRLLRPNPAGGMLRGEYLATSTDGGLTFGPNIRISDGLYANRTFNGDYDDPVAVGNRLHAIWADARLGDNDIFTQSIDLDDFDEDGVLNDGDLDGQYADHRCAGGATADCDDNCPGVPNPGQADADHDGIGDACDAAA